MSGLKDTYLILKDKYGFSSNDFQAWTLMKADLMELITRDRLGYTGVYGLVNRLKVLFQQPSIISIFEGDQSNLRFTTFTDPIHESEGREYLDSFSGKPWPQFVQVFDSCFYILVSKIRRIEEGGDITIKLVDYPDSQGCFKIFRALFDTEIMTGDPLFCYLEASNYWSRAIENVINSRNKQYISPIKVRYDASRLIQESSALTKRVYSAVEYSYSEVKKSKLLQSTYDQSKPANVFYFIRTYEKPRKRFGQDRYNYQVRMVVPDEQERLIEDVFKQIKKSFESLQGNDWEYGGRSFAHFEDSRYVEELASLLKSAAGVAEIIRILKEPHGKHVRSFLDPVFATGFSDLRRDALNGKYALDRIERNFEFSKVAREDRIRIAAMYYLFSAVVDADNKQAGNISCYVKPLRVDSSPWLCFVTFAEFEDINEENYLNWQLYRHFYYDICITQGRRIRGAVRRAYLKTIEEIICDGFLTPRFEVNTVPLSSFEEYTNTRLEDICRYFPYPRLIVSVSRSKPQHQLFSVVAAKEPLYIIFELSINPFYPALMGNAFSGKEYLVRYAISNGIDKFMNDEGEKIYHEAKID